MKELLLPFDDNWGSVSEPAPYPALPRKAAVSKSVQKRREKQAKSFQNLVDSTIVLGRTSVLGRKARLQTTQRLQAEAVRQPDEQPQQSSAAEPVSKKTGKAQKNNMKKVAVTDKAGPAVKEQLTEPSSTRRAPTEQATGSLSQPLPSAAVAQPPLKRKKQAAGQLAASPTEAGQASSGVQKPKKRRRAQELTDARTEPVPSGQSEPHQKLPGKKHKRASNEQWPAGREKGMPPSGSPTAGPASSRRERAEAAAQKRARLAASTDGAAEVREDMQPAKAKGRQSHELPAKEKRRKSGQKSAAVQSIKEAREVHSHQSDKSPVEGAPPAEKNSRRSGQKTGTVESMEEPREPEQNRGQQETNGNQQDELPAKKKRRKSGIQTAAVQSSKETQGPERIRGKQKAQGLGNNSSGGSRKEEPDPPEAAARQGGQQPAPTPGLMDKMAARLHGSRFRWLNETLYTSTGDTAFALMQDQPELFDQYHKGFQQQTKNWPQQPVDAAIAWLRKLPSSLRVADFGCGDAALALAVDQKVACLDLVANVPGVIACNMSNTPLETGSMDVAVFCLALMGTDYPAFLREAARVVKPRGKLWIAEIRSRFASEAGLEDYRPFFTALRSLGFELLDMDASNKMFVVFQLQKTLGSGDFPESTAPWPELKPCLYKRR